MRERLDNHAGAIFLEDFKGMRERGNRISHVMQTVEKGHQVVTFPWRLPGSDRFEVNIVTSVLFSNVPRVNNAWMMEIET